MIAVDTNLLVYAHREDSLWHSVASRKIAKLAEGPSLWGIPWPCLHEFLAVVTHPKIYNPPTPLGHALAQIDAWVLSPYLVLLSETEEYWQRLKPILQQGRIAGPQIHDARIAAICSLHGVRELWTADRDFGRFPKLTVHNPLVE